MAFDARAPGEIVRPNIDPDRGDKHERADPKPWRMMNAPPVALGRFGMSRVPVVMFFIHGRSIPSLLTATVRSSHMRGAAAGRLVADDTQKIVDFPTNVWMKQPHVRKLHPA